MKKFTTSAQKTLFLPKDVIIKTLEDTLSKDINLKFSSTKAENIKEAKLDDGSKLIIAAFDKENGKTLAMIDHKDLSVTNARATAQRKLRTTLDNMF